MALEPKEEISAEVHKLDTRPDAVRSRRRRSIRADRCCSSPIIDTDQGLNTEELRRRAPRRPEQTQVLAEHRLARLPQELVSPGKQSPGWSPKRKSLQAERLRSCGRAKEARIAQR